VLGALGELRSHSIAADIAKRCVDIDPLAVFRPYQFQQFSQTAAIKTSEQTDLVIWT
jgi:hypothetical protein